MGKSARCGRVRGLTRFLGRIRDYGRKRQTKNDHRRERATTNWVYFKQPCLETESANTHHAPSNQAIVQEATESLRAAIADSSEFASWIGFEALQQGLDLQTAINIVHEIEAGHYTLDDLFIASQTKSSSGVHTRPYWGWG